MMKIKMKGHGVNTTIDAINALVSAEGKLVDLLRDTAETDGDIRPISEVLMYIGSSITSISEVLMIFEDIDSEKDGG